jgi:heme exporter protein C
MPKLSWWKILSLVLLTYICWQGFLGPVPRLHIVNESIRNTYFHVPMWFGMVFLLTASVWNSIQYLRKGDLEYDVKSHGYIQVGIIYGILGLLTGMVWANYTWGAPWSNDPKQTASAIGLMIYFGCLVLRGSISAVRDKARISSVYSIFAYAIFIPLIFILPRFTDSLHPGNGGNPAFGKYDMDNNMRLVFYPAVIAWILVGAWIAELVIRTQLLENRISENEYNQTSSGEPNDTVLDAGNVAG